MNTVLLILLLAMGATAAALYLRLRRQHQNLIHEHAQLTARVQGIIDVEAEKQRVLAELAAEKSRVLGQLEAERARQGADLARGRLAYEQGVRTLEEQRQRAAAEQQALQASIERLRAEMAALEEQADLHSFGFYKPRYDFASSERYEAKLEEIRARQKQMLKDRTAAACHTQWHVNGSLVEGRKQINQTLKMMLRAFNGECDAAIARVKYNNVTVMETRIQKAFDSLNALAQIQQCTIEREYLNLKFQELYLAHEYQEKQKEEREEQRRIREQMREEEQALREMEKARQDAERDEKRFAEALQKARREVEHAAGREQDRLQAQIEDLQRRLDEARQNKERAIARAQMTRSGHVYVISNIGSFGENVYKIGMTRRLDPMERVRELGDASVPFLFDVHAILYSDDAPALEAELHRAFERRRVNRVNERKEFFRASIDEIAQVVRRHRGEIEITRLAEAEEYRKTLALAQQERTAGGTPVGNVATAAAPTLPGSPGSAVPSAPTIRPPSAASVVLSPGKATTPKTYRVIDTDGQLSPPVDETHLRDLAQRGFVGPGTQIIESDTGAASVLGEHPAIRTVFAAKR